MNAYAVLILILTTGHGIATEHVPFGSREACIAARDDIRQRAGKRFFPTIELCECYDTGAFSTTGRRQGRID